jgi:endonuclease III
MDVRMETQHMDMLRVAVKAVLSTQTTEKSLSSTPEESM